MNTKLSEELLDAVASEDHELILSLIGQGVDIECLSKYQQTPLLIAIDNGSVETVKLLLDNGADVNSDRGYSLPLLLEIDTAIQESNNDSTIKEDSTEIIELLLAYGADILKRSSRNSKNAYELALNRHQPAQRLFEKILGAPPSK